MKYSLQDILSGNVLGHSWFKDQYKLIVLISSLIFLYIYSGYQSQRQQRELGELQTVLQDVQMTKMTVNAQLMEKTRQSSIVSLLQHKGSDLKESKTPAIRIQ
jgi:surface polysaccharide O-acyltransferase-like enzyme